MAFNEVLERLVGNKKDGPDLLDMHKAFSIVATLYVEDALNLVAEAAISTTDPGKVLARADTMFTAWELEISSLKSAIQDNLGRRGLR